MDNRLENWMNWILYDELMKGEINAPKQLLGNHDFGKGQVITVYKPHSVSVKITSPTGKNEMDLEPIEDEGMYS